jgi:pseudaminic acid synthase
VTHLIRPARQSDIDAVYIISNDQVVRSQSLNTEPIPWEQHVEWFKQKLEDPNVLFLIAEIQEGAVFAQIRYEIAGVSALVNLSVHADYRGKGLASGLLEEGDRRLFEQHQTMDRVVAQILPDNIASAKAFLKAGYLLRRRGQKLGSGAVVDVYEKRRRKIQMNFPYEMLKQDSSAAFIVAELSANHHGSFDIAADTIRAMKDAGADAVKVQTYTPETMTIDSDQEYFTISQGTVWDGKTLHALYEEAHMPWEWQPRLKELADSLGLLFFSSPFDVRAVDLLEEMGTTVFKVASFEITDTPLIEYIASKGKPVIISTGVASLQDIQDALTACYKVGNFRVALLKCTSAYPAPISESNLRTIPNMRETFRTVVGLSDHTIGSTTAVVAVTLGAKIIEKHFILDRRQGGPDSSFSMEPKEFAGLVRSVREAEQAVGHVSYDLPEIARKNRAFTRSLFVVLDIKKGEVLSELNIRSIRPGFGLHPRHIGEVLGKHARVSLRRGTPLEWVHIE